MEQAQSIDDILNGEQAEAPVAEAPEVQTEQPETAERPRGPDGKFVKKEETGVEPQQETPAEQAPPASQPDQLPRDVYEPLKAIRDENKELKAQLAAIQRQMMQAPQPQPQPQQPSVDFWDDPHGYMSQQFAQFGQQLLGEWEHKQQVTRINASEEAAKAKHADYDEAYLAFEQAVQTNPRLAVELAQSSDPGEYAYSKGKAALAIQNVGSLDALKAQVRAELEAEARAAIAPAQRPTLPSTTAADGSVGARTGPAWGGPKSIDQILGS